MDFLRPPALAGLMGVILFGGIVSVTAASASALSDRYAAAVQQLLDSRQPAEAEAQARAGLREVVAAEGENSLATANMNRLLGDALYEQRKFAEAEPHFRAALSTRQRLLGNAHADTATSAGDLGYTLRQLGRLDEAEQYYQLAVDARIAALGANHATTVHSWQRLARLVDQRGDYLRAASLMDKALEAGRIAFDTGDPILVGWIGERAAMLHDGGDVARAEADYRAVLRAAGEGIVPADGQIAATALTGLGNLLVADGRFKEAGENYRRALAANERLHGPQDVTVAASLESLGRLMERQEKAAAALPFYERALSIREASGGAADAATASLLMRLGTTMMSLDRSADAERVFRRLMAAQERLNGADSAPMADALRWIANAANRQDRTAEAENALKRALAIDEAKLSSGHPYIAFDLVLLANLYSSQDRLSEARPLLERGLALMEAGESGKGSLPAVRSSLAYILVIEGDLDGAAALMTRSLEELRTADRGAAQIAGASVSLAQIKVRQEKLDEAERLAADAERIYADLAPQGRQHMRVMTLRGDIAMRRGDTEAALFVYRSVLDRLVATYGADNPETAMARFDLGRVHFARGEFAAAAQSLEKGTELVERVAAIDAAAAFATRTGAIEDQAIGRGATFDGLVKSYDRLRRTGGDNGELKEKSFLIAQRVIESQAAQALAQMAARQASGDGDLAELARRRQDEVARWRKADLKLNAALAVDTSKRDSAAVAAIRSELQAADTAIAEVDQRLARAFPKFAELQQPASLDFEAIRQRLDENEVLLFFADTARFADAGFETYLWAVPKTGEPRWIRLERSTGELLAAVRELRSLMGVSGEARGAASLAARRGTDPAGRVLTAAHELYDATLAPVADMIDGRDLVIVPSKRLASLPFHLLVSERPAAESSDRYRDAGWLARDHAITVLPSVGALRVVASAAPRPGSNPYLGFANPLLTGNNGSDTRAFGRETCRDRAPLQTAALAETAPDVSILFRGALADVSAVRGLEPLPETADEACAIAATLGAGADSVRLGEKATETEIKRLSASGETARARILHFATHGLVSGDLEGLAEPAIVMTPPEKASTEDDGLLTASEVAGLKLDADWVILSACNTAAGESGGEALSGLARAFFYAGARSLMVSHWPVASDAAVRLATGAIAEMAGDGRLSRAEALRRAMVEEIRAGGHRADPANWAPFIVVGG